MYILVKLNTGVVCCYAVSFIYLGAGCLSCYFGNVLTPV